MSTLSPAFARKMERRRPLHLDPARPFAIKRNLHEFVIGAQADAFAAVFREILEAPDARFGPLQVKRMPGREGQPFVVGERFSGCLVDSWLGDAFFSDYAEIVEIEPRRVVYRYLSGCPIAGSSTFLVEPLGEHCRLRVIFEYQELHGLAISILHRFGHRMHDRVTRMQVERAAERLAAPILSSTL